jgi:hypothetical protein
MSVDTAWSAASLQRPVQNHLARTYQAINAITGNNMRNQVLGVDPRRLPNRGPQAILARNPLERQVMGSPGVFATATPAPTALPGLERAVQRPGTNLVQPVTQPKAPGLDPAIATAIPKTPTPSDGIPQMSQISGWLSPGKNFSIN